MTNQASGTASCLLGKNGRKKFSCSSGTGVWQNGGTATPKRGWRGWELKNGMSARL